MPPPRLHVGPKRGMSSEGMALSVPESAILYAPLLLVLVLLCGHATAKRRGGMVLLFAMALGGRGGGGGERENIGASCLMSRQQQECVGERER